MSYRSDGYVFPQTGVGIDGYDKIIGAQGALGLFAHGGDIIIRSGDGYADGYDGYDGYVRLQTGTNRDVITLDGYNVSLFQQIGSYGTGKKVVFIANAKTVPTNNPAGGGLLYVQDGDGYWRNPTGLIQSISGSRIVRAFPSNADYTAVFSDYTANIIEATGALATSAKKFILPNVSGYQWTVYNNTTGGQSIIFIVSGGALGVTVANGKRAIIYCDGNDIVRATADV